MLQVPIFNGLSFDPFTLFEDGLSPAKVGISGRDVFQALVIALVVVVLDEGVDLGFKVTGQEVVFQQDGVLVRLNSQVLRPAHWARPRCGF